MSIFNSRNRKKNLMTIFNAKIQITSRNVLNPYFFNISFFSLISYNMIVGLTQKINVYLYQKFSAKVENK